MVIARWSLNIHCKPEEAILFFFVEKIESLSLVNNYLNSGQFYALNWRNWNIFQSITNFKSSRDNIENCSNYETGKFQVFVCDFHLITTSGYSPLTCMVLCCLGFWLQYQIFNSWCMIYWLLEAKSPDVWSFS